MKIRIVELEEGQRIPRGYGVAYYNFATNRAVCYPIPFNILVNLMRKLYFKIINPSLDEVERKCAKAYGEGVLKGWKLHTEEIEKELEQYLAREKER